MARVLIGAAHTLENPGEIYKDLREADLTRKILAKTIPHLSRLKIDYKDVPLDLPLTDRITWINNTGYTKANGDIFVEIHINDGGKTGVESWFRGNSTVDNHSQRLAELLLQNFCKRTGYVNNGARSEYDHEMTSLLILNQTNPIATAIEILYIDNPADIVLLKDDSKLEEIGKALAESINDYLEAVKSFPVPNNAIIPAQNANNLNSEDQDENLDDEFPSIMPKTNYPFVPKPPAILPSANKAPLLMDRDQRKEMIKKTYLKILGREPTPQESNSGLNTAISEEELAKKLLESDEFKKILEEAKNSEELKAQFSSLNAEIVALKQDKIDLVKTYETLTTAQEFKNAQIKKLSELLTQNGIIPKGQNIDTYKNSTKEKAQIPINGPKKKKKLTFLELIMKIFRL